MLDTDQLRSFLAIVDTGSFTKAAERVHKTQSAVSMHIRRLEEQLGRDLFVKNGRGVRLSADGEQLVDYARDMLRIEASAMAAIARRGLRGQIRLGIPDDYAEPFLPLILARFLRRHPLVEISVVCEGSLQLATRVRDRDLDLALVTDCAAIAGVEVIREEPLVWVAAPRLRLPAGEPVPLALGGSGCIWRQSAEAALQAAGLPFRLVLVSHNYSAIAPLVTQGLAITVLPAGAVRPGLQILGERDDLPALAHSRMGLLRAASATTPEAGALADEIREAVALAE